MGCKISTRLLFPSNRASATAAFRLMSPRPEDDKTAFKAMLRNQPWVIIVIMCAVFVPLLAFGVVAVDRWAMAEERRLIRE